MLAIRAQAPYTPAYRELFAENDTFVHETVAAIIAGVVGARLPKSSKYRPQYDYRD